MKSRYITLLFILLILALVAVGYFIDVPYNVNSRGMILPAKEWSLKKTGVGTLATVFRDNLNNTTTHFSVTEFQRGNLAEFSLNPELLNKGAVAAGDTIGIITSSEEEKRLVELQAELKVQQSLLDVYSTGEKPEAVQMAYNAMIKAEHEYETQKKVTERNENLFAGGYIAAEEFELLQNAYMIKKQNLNIARSNYEAVNTGAKPEQINFILATISALELQLEQVNARLRSFVILSPLQGQVVGHRGYAGSDEIILSISDRSSLITILPIEVHQLTYVHGGQEIILRIGSYGISFKARIISIDNSVQMIDQRQRIFVTAVLEDSEHLIMPGMIADADIKCGLISLGEYIRRLFRIVIAN
jgi:multidrug resistance efflux pump